MSSAEEEASISLPSIAFVAVLGFIIYRYFFAAPSSTPSQSSTSRNVPSLRFTTMQVDQISAMFPQLDRRDIMWDLHRNRGSMQATMDRILMAGRLEPAPPTFHPTLTPATSASSPTSPVAASPKVVAEPDLITRYNLQSRVDASAKGKEKEEPDHGWSSSKGDREAMLKRRRDEMILNARRKMMERDAGAAAS